MKNNTFLAIVVLFGILNCNAQKIDLIPNDQIKINNQITLGDSPTALITAFANQNNEYEITDGFWEMHDANVKNYIFNGGTFTFLENQLADFEITSSDYYIQTDLGKIRVGNNISTLKFIYPASYDFKADGNLSVSIGTGDYQFLLIEYDENNIIKCIETRFY